MKRSRPLRAFARPPGDWGRFAEAFLCLGAGRAAIRLLGFRRISRFLGVPNRESALTPEPDLQNELSRVVWALDAAARRTPWQSSCLVRALAGRAMLHRRRIASTLYLGVSRSLPDPGSLGAHAWLRSGATLVTGGEEQRDYTAVARFADCARHPREAP